ncbi:alpha/beta hydrolase [Acuticoccus sp. M5D2P5]|uniref:alpha/beta fold hydrolase n=1 Tax=Acuticoccus kalidii TaxID=2910977 RepID=UPI001F1B887D|nr:alpha/beta hydrolase [Acuticoccus kalidii]MCF3935224.1 alpha/beta hydrolase [Acuticoccus kalidii]
MSEPFFVTAAGRRLRAVLHGEQAAGRPTIVFLHEGLGSIGQWHDFPARLAEKTGLPVLVYERHGYGQSEPLDAPRPIDFIEREADTALPDVLAACHIDRPILFGHSDGGTIALLYAAAFPDKPVAVITEAAHVMVEAETSGSLKQLRAKWSEDERLRSGLGRYHGDQTEAMFYGWIDAWLRPQNQAWQMLGRLPSITCPVLAVQGMDDEHGTPAQVDHIVDDTAGPAERFMIPECGHVPHREAPDAVLDRVAAFIASVGAEA